MLESLQTAQQLSIHSASWFLVCAIEASLPRATCSKRSGRQQLRAPYPADTSALSGFSSRTELGLMTAGSQQSQGANFTKPSSRCFLSHEFSLDPSTQQKARFQPRQLSSSGWRTGVQHRLRNGLWLRRRSHRGGVCPGIGRSRFKDRKQTSAGQVRGGVVPPGLPRFCYSRICSYDRTP